LVLHGGERRPAGHFADEEQHEDATPCSNSGFVDAEELAQLRQHVKDLEDAPDEVGGCMKYWEAHADRCDRIMRRVGTSAAGQFKLSRRRLLQQRRLFNVHLRSKQGGVIASSP